MNTSRPELNREFDIEFVPDFEVEGGGKTWDCPGFHIRALVASFKADHTSWTATIPNPNLYHPELLHRLIMVKGPSQNAWFKDNDVYHGTGMVNCWATKKAHNKTLQAIKNDPARQVVYYLLVFPEEIVLNNLVFGSDSFLPKIANKMELEAKKSKKVQKDLRGTAVFWKIAIVGGVQVDDQEYEEDEEW